MRFDKIAGALVAMIAGLGVAAMALLFDDPTRYQILPGMSRARRRELIASGKVRVAGGAPDVGLFPLSRHVGITLNLVPLLRDNTAASGATIDLQADAYKDYDHFLFVVGVGATDITVDAKLQDSPDDSAWTDITSAAVTQIAADEDDGHVLIEISRESLTQRYLKIVVTIGDGTAGADTVVFVIAYGGGGEMPRAAMASQAEAIIVAATQAGN